MMPTPEEVCDRVFGTYTRRAPTPMWLNNYGAGSWDSIYGENSLRRPHEFWVEPRSQRIESDEDPLLPLPTAYVYERAADA